MKRRFLRRPRQRLGQHFLHDPGVLARIAATAEIDRKDTVLEIGAGRGALTRHLNERAAEGTVLALEIDAALAPNLEALRAESGRIVPVRADVLRLDLADLLETHGLASPIVVVGNLPYAITTPILERLIEWRALWKSATVMVQEEVARRLVAEPGEPGCGSISVFLHYHCAVRYLFRVGPGAFSPPPRVQSAVIRLVPHDVAPVGLLDETWLFRVARTAFGQRRKTLRNALRRLDPALTRDGLEAAFAAAEVDPTRRAETLSLDEFAALANAFCEVVTKPCAIG